MKPSRALTSLAAAINQLQLLAEGPDPVPAAWSHREILPGPLRDSRPSPSSSLMLSGSAPRAGAGCLHSSDLLSCVC